MLTITYDNRDYKFVLRDDYSMNILFEDYHEASEYAKEKNMFDKDGFLKHPFEICLINDIAHLVTVCISDEYSGVLIDETPADYL